MTTNEFYSFPEDEALLSPGEALLNCNGQDITKKNAGKARNRILTIFPANLGLPLKLTDCVLGNIRNLNSDAPEFVVSTEQGELIFKGKFEYPSTKFLSITCQPSTAKRTGQSALTDVFDKVLVFDEPTLQPHSEGSAPTSMFRSSSVNSATSELFGTQNSEAGVTAVSASAYSKHFGMSSVADPIRPATAKRVGTLATKAPSSSSKSKARSSAQTSSSPKKRSRSQKSAGSDSSDQSGSESDNGSSVGTNSQGESDAGDDSASDVEEELGGALLGSDSPVQDRRSSSRRASAAKAVSYRESDEEEEDERSYSSTESGSRAASPTKASRLEIKTIDIAESSEDEGQLVTKPKASRATPKKSAEKAKAAPKPKVASAAKTTPTASKAPTARKLAASSSSSTKKTKKGGYFSDVSENEESDGPSDASANGSDLSPVRVSGRARPAAAKSNAKTHRVAQESDSNGESEASVDASEESDFLFEDSSSSKKRKASAAKPAAKSTKPASAQKSTATVKSSAKKPKVSPTEKESAKKPAAVKKSASKAPAKRNNRRIDSEDEVITIDDSEDNDSDYED